MSNITYINNFSEIRPELNFDDDYSISMGHALTTDQVRELTGWMNGRKVTTLNLSHTRLTDEAADWIAAAIHSDDAGRRGLSSVDLSNNRIGDQGAKTLAEVAKRVGNIRIELANNRITSDGAVEFVAGVAEGNVQRSVDLQGNRIDDEGAKEMSLRLASSRGKIEHLDLQDNRITLKGDEYMAQYLPKWIDVTYRKEKISFQQWHARHPGVALFFAAFLCPIYVIMHFVQPQMEEPIEGLLHTRTGPQ